MGISSPSSHFLQLSVFPIPKSCTCFLRYQFPKLVTNPTYVIPSLLTVPSQCWNFIHSSKIFSIDSHLPCNEETKHLKNPLFTSFKRGLGYVVKKLVLNRGSHLINFSNPLLSQANREHHITNSFPFLPIIQIRQISNPIV